ncbi:class A beta-lactamase [Nocardioides sp. Soil805]|uniref:class A beta-lactamase n=1 Tax=Nocardioides sp. Soil805 TaxID=1736416 RepID=UPI0019110B3A|nr:class A beta-lactamase [Nocardioides sp. Soil805]
MKMFTIGMAAAMTGLCRRIGAGLAALVVMGCAGADAGADDPQSPAAVTPDGTFAASDTCATDEDAFAGRLRHLEREKDAVVGVYAFATGTGEDLAYRADERFAFASTGKALAAAVVLDQLSSRDLSRRLYWTEADLVPYSPVTELHVEDGLTVRAVLEAAVTVSDNTAANLMFDLIGGPRGLDEALEDVGDDTTEAVRREPDLNDYTPGDVRDTTTPRAIASSLAAFAVGGELKPSDERLFNNMLLRNTTGDALIRAAVPASWRVGDKTGSASYGTRNDIAVVTSPGRTPVVVAVLTRHSTADAATDDGLVAEAARAVVGSWCGPH